MDFTEVNAYMEKLYSAGPYFELPSHEQQTAVFEATELLADEFGADKLTPRIVALQTLYMIEGEAEEYAMLKRQGVKNLKVKDLSVEFDAAFDIAPAVIKIMTPSASAGNGSGMARVGRLI